MLPDGVTFIRCRCFGVDAAGRGNLYFDVVDAVSMLPDEVTFIRCRCCGVDAAGRGNLRSGRRNLYLMSLMRR